MNKNRVTIIGLGHRGLSIAAAIRPVIEDVEVIGHDKSAEASKNAADLKLVDKTEWNLLAACEGARLIIIAIPQSGLEQTLRAIGAEAQPGVIITELCPNKAASLALGKMLSEEIIYIGSDLVFNPEKGEPQNGKPDSGALRGAVWTMSPRPGTSPEGVDALVGIVSQMEAYPILIDPTEHDGFRLALNTVPAALGFSLLAAVTSDSAWQDRQWLAGAEFGLATAGINEGRSQDLASAMLANPPATRHWINQVMLKLMALRDAVDGEDEAALAAMLKSAIHARESWLGDWRRGRGPGLGTSDVKRPSILGTFVGESLAGKLRGGRKPGQA